MIFDVSLVVQTYCYANKQNKNYNHVTSYMTSLGNGGEGDFLRITGSQGKRCLHHGITC